MQGQVSSVKPSRWGVLLTATSLLGTLLLPGASASAKMAQTVTFTSSPPSLAVAGASYEVSAKSSSGEPVLLDAEGACSTERGPSEYHLGEEQEEAREKQPLKLSRSPATIYSVAAGQCKISAFTGYTAEYEEAPEVSQTFSVTRDPSEQITFTTNPPSEAHVGGSYVPAVRSSQRVDVYFSSAAPSVCPIKIGEASAEVSFIAAGTCTVDVRQKGVSEAEPPEVQQSFTVQKGPQTVTFTNTPPSNAMAGGSYGVTATSSAGLPVEIRAGGACSFTARTDEEETLAPPTEEEAKEIAEREPRVHSPATVFFNEAGTCTIEASARSNSEYESSPSVSQSFAVVKASEQITFISSPPSEAALGASYHPSVRLSAGVRVSFSTSTPSVCTVKLDAVALLGVGTCTIVVRQEGVSEAEPPEAQQSFTVIKKPQTITFTSIPPTPAVAGESYTVSAAETSGLGVELQWSGACAYSRRETEQRLQLEVVEERWPVPISPVTVSFVEAGTCTIKAIGSANSEFQSPPEVSQSILVSKDPSEQIVFASQPPTPATVGEAYDPVVRLSVGVRVSFVTTTPSVCTIAPEAVSLKSVGTCSIGVRQGGISEAEPPEAEQSFTVIAATPTPLSSNSLALIGKPSVDQRSGAVKLKSACPSAGALSWRLTYKGPSGETRSYGEGAMKLSGASTPTITVEPSAAALKALKRAHKHGHGLSVKAVLTFGPSSGAGPLTLERLIVVRLA